MGWEGGDNYFLAHSKSQRYDGKLSYICNKCLFFCDVEFSLDFFSAFQPVKIIG
jgi:hypothetical protein